MSPFLEVPLAVYDEKLLRNSGFQIFNDRKFRSRNNAQNGDNHTVILKTIIEYFY